MKQFFPIFDWLPAYTKKHLSGDLAAGITVGVMLIPQGMAYAMLAGLPPIYGLYASVVPLIIYAIMGTSRQLAVGPVAMVSLLIASGVGALANSDQETFIQLAIALSLMIGLIQLLMGLFRMGFLVNFLSHPVISGFTSAAAIYIAVSQLKHLFGLDIPRGKLYETLYSIGQQIGEVNGITLGIGLGAIAVILGLKKISKRIPFPLIVVLLGLVLGYLIPLGDYGVSVVKEVPSGLPSFAVPNVSFEQYLSLIPIAITIALIGFTESIAVAKSIQKRHKDYEVVPNQELVALGSANILGSFFQAFPTTGGFARSAVNDQSGAKTGMASMVSAVVIILTLLFLTAYFDNLPKAVLASIIIVAVFNLIDVKEARHLWKTDRRDFWMFIVTAMATLILGVEPGIMVGIGVSIIGLLIRVSYPHIAELGLDPRSNTYLNVNRFKQIETLDDILIVRHDAQLFFANTRFFQDTLRELEAKKKDLKAVIIDARGINNMDSSAIHALRDMVNDYHKRNIKFIMTNVKGPVRDILRRSEMRKLIGEEHFFLSIEDALEYLRTNSQKAYSDIALQSNVE